MIARWKLLAGCALVLAPLPAAAQLGAPVATGQQQTDPLARRAAAAQVAVPPAEAAPYQPTVIEGLSNRARVCQEEIFGPVLVALPFDDEVDVIEQGNDTVFGLAAGIWTRDYACAWRVARERRRWQTLGFLLALTAKGWQARARLAGA